MITRRGLLGTVRRPQRPAVARADVPDHLWQGYDLGLGRRSRTASTRGHFPSSRMRVGGPSPPQRRRPGRFEISVWGSAGIPGGGWTFTGRPAGRQTLENHVERMASLPFVDVLYIRCDWRDVQTRPGKLDLNPVWKLTLDAAKAHGKRVAFRVMLSNTAFQPKRLAMPDFLSGKVPVVAIGRARDLGGNTGYREPRYDHPEFLRAFRELNELLAAEFDGHAQIEFVDLMMYGFWGEGHTSDLPAPIPGLSDGERTMVGITKLQLEAWKKTPLAVNTQPDISRVGNREVQDMCVREGCWLRSDSILNIEEPLQIEMLANRPPWLAAVMEDGEHRNYDVNTIPKDAAGINERRRRCCTCWIGRELLVALDRERESEALSRAVSARLFDVAAPYGLPRAPLVGVAAQTRWRQRGDRLYRQRRRFRCARAAATIFGKHGWQIPNDRWTGCRSAVRGQNPGSQLYGAPGDPSPAAQTARGDRSEGSAAAGAMDLRTAGRCRWVVCGRVAGA